MPEPGSQERLRAVLTNQRLPADDPGLPLPAFLDRTRPLSALPAVNPFAFGTLGETSSSSRSENPFRHVACYANAIGGRKA
jgi:hypothetical protein